MAKLWGGRFSKGTDKAVEDFTSSISFDNRMYAEDIAGSKAHAMMLAKQGIISQADADAILAGLTAIKNQIEEGKFDFSLSLEDIHMNIEKRLTDAIGEAGGRLHTGRSRNDQCAVDLHMLVKKAVVTMGHLLVDLQSTGTSGCNYAWLYPPSTGSASSFRPSYDGLFLHVGTGF